MLFHIIASISVTNSGHMRDFLCCVPFVSEGYENFHDNAALVVEHFTVRNYNCD